MMLLILNRFTKKELFNFEYFIKSPFFNTNDKIIKLFYYLKKGYPYLDIGYISRANISLHVYSEIIVNDIKVRKLISQFYKLIKEFLLYDTLRKNVAANEIISIKNLEGTELENMLPEMFTGLEDQFSKTFLKNKHYYYNLINFEREDYLMKVKEELKVDKYQIKSCYKNIDYQYMILKLECYYDSLTLNADLSKVPEMITGINAVLNYIASRKEFFIKHHPLIYFKYLGVMLKSTMDDRYEQELLNCFKKDLMKYDEDFSFSYYSFLENFYYKKTGEPGDYYKRKLIGVFDDIYIKGLYVKSNSRRTPKMHSRNYFRVVQMAYSLKDYEWAEKFIRRSKSGLYPVNAREVYNLSLARLHFEKKDFRKSYSYLNKVVYKDNYCFIHSKFLFTRICFETGDYSGAENTVNNLQKYLRRNKDLSPFERAHLKKFLFYIPQLLKVYKAEGEDKDYLAYILKKNLDDDKDHIASKNWYYEKLGQLTVDS